MVTRMNLPPTPPATEHGKKVHFIRRNLPRFFLLFLILLIVILSVVISQKKQTLEEKKKGALKQTRPPINVVVMPLTPTTIRDRIKLPGIIEPWQRLVLSARVGGAITEVLVEEGAEVKKGQLLARIESDDYRIALDRAWAAHQLAVSDLDRDQKLFAKKALSPARLEARKAHVDATRADLKNAELQLSRCAITAPFTGLVHKLHVKPGLFLAIGDPVGELLQMDRVKAVIGIPESDVSAVRHLKHVAVTIKALDNQVISAPVHLLASAPESAAALYRLELALDNPQRQILPGMYVSGDVVKTVRENVIVVPFYAVISRNNHQVVFVEKDGRAEKREVQTGIMEKWSLHITNGLQAADRLIIEGHRDVENGQMVNVVHTTDQQAQTP